MPNHPRSEEGMYLRLLVVSMVAYRDFQRTRHQGAQCGATGVDAVQSAKGTGESVCHRD